ncbi:MAG: DUF2958 domain-containing protein [Peptoniphilaceae bacterium]
MEKSNNIFEIALNRKVYIGSDKYKIIDFTEKEVSLQKLNQPVSVDKMDIEEFQNKVGVNPLNKEYFVENNDLFLGKSIVNKKDIVEASMKDYHDLSKTIDSDTDPFHLVTETMKRNVPDIYATENIKNKDKTVQAIYFAPFSGWSWYMTELDKKTNIAFGLIAGHEVEWGYFSLDELKGVKAQRLINFEPKTFEELKNTELKNNLAPRELQIAFNGELKYEENLGREIKLESKKLKNDNIILLTDSELKDLESNNLDEEKISFENKYVTYKDGLWVGIIHDIDNKKELSFTTIDECLLWLNTNSLEIERKENSSELDRAKDLIRKFLESEYDNKIDEKTFIDLSNIALAFTTTEDDKHEIQAVIDLKEPALKQYLDGNLVHEEKYQSLTDLIDYQLEYLDFGNLITIETENLGKIKTELDYDRDNDGVIDRHDADFRDSKVMTLGDLDEREKNRASEKCVDKEKLKASLLEKLKPLENESKKNKEHKKQENIWER